MGKKLTAASNKITTFVTNHEIIASLLVLALLAIVSLPLTASLPIAGASATFTATVGALTLTVLLLLIPAVLLTVAGYYVTTKMQSPWKWPLLVFISLSGLFLLLFVIAAIIGFAALGAPAASSMFGLFLALPGAVIVSLTAGTAVSTVLLVAIGVVGFVALGGIVILGIIALGRLFSSREKSILYKTKNKRPTVDTVENRIDQHPLEKIKSLKEGAEYSKKGNKNLLEKKDENLRKPFSKIDNDIDYLKIAFKTLEETSLWGDNFAEIKKNLDVFSENTQRNDASENDIKNLENECTEIKELFLGEVEKGLGNLRKSIMGVKKEITESINSLNNNIDKKDFLDRLNLLLELEYQWRNFFINFEVDSDDIMQNPEEITAILSTMENHLDKLNNLKLNINNKKGLKKTEADSDKKNSLKKFSSSDSDNNNKAKDQQIDVYDESKKVEEIKRDLRDLIKVCNYLLFLGFQDKNFKKTKLILDSRLEEASLITQGACANYLENLRKDVDELEKTVQEFFEAKMDKIVADSKPATQKQLPELQDLIFTYGELETYNAYDKVVLDLLRGCIEALKKPFKGKDLEKFNRLKKEINALNLQITQLEKNFTADKHRQSLARAKELLGQGELLLNELKSMGHYKEFRSIEKILYRLKQALNLFSSNDNILPGPKSLEKIDRLLKSVGKLINTWSNRGYQCESVNKVKNKDSADYASHQEFVPATNEQENQLADADAEEKNNESSVEEDDGLFEGQINKKK